MASPYQYYRQVIKLFLTCIVLTLVACSTNNSALNKQETDQSLVWPPAPDRPHIEYLGKLSQPADIGISKGFLAVLSSIALGDKNNGMVLPMAVVENNKQQLYVADPGVKGIHRFDRKRGRYHLIKRVGGKDFESPVSLATDESGNVYIVDSVLAKVFIIGSDDDEAVQVSMEDDFIRPTGIVIDKVSGWIYVVDTAIHKIIVFDKELKLITKFGRRGSSMGEFNYPTYIWQTKDRKLLITDSLNFRIQRFDHKGTYLDHFGSPGNAIGSLSRPKGIAQDKYGHIYVVDALFHNVQLFNSSGELLMYFGRQGNNPGEFWLPVGIYISDDDTIYLCDSYNRRVQIFKYIGDDI